MPLNPAALTSAPGLPGAGGRAYPGSRAEAVQEWADALEAYVAGIVAPSAQVPAAVAALKPALDAAFQTTNNASAMEAAFKAFAATIAAGQAPAFVGVPPAGPVGFADLFSMAPPQTTAEGVARVAAKIHAWMITGTSAVAVPPGPPVPWA